MVDVTADVVAAGAAVPPTPRLGVGRGVEAIAVPEMVLPGRLAAGETGVCRGERVLCIVSDVIACWAWARPPPCAAGATEAATLQKLAGSRPGARHQCGPVRARA